VAELELEAVVQGETMSRSSKQ